MFNLSRFIFLLLFPILAWSRECESIKKIFLVDKIYQNQDVADLKSGVDSGDMCFRNLMGIMVYNGIYFAKDLDRAEDIFSDLSNKNYPEAQFNFALITTKKLEQNPELTTNLLIGIYYKYADDKKNAHLASSAKNLGQKYIESLPELVSSCASKDYKCSDSLSKLSALDITKIQDGYNSSIRDAQFSVAAKRLNITKDTEKQANNLMAILSLGLLIYNLNSAPMYNNGGRAQTINGTEVWLDKSFGSRPLHLNTYQFPGTFW
jgi:hypothetical protein